MSRHVRWPQTAPQMAVRPKAAPPPVSLQTSFSFSSKTRLPANSCDPSPHPGILCHWDQKILPPGLGRRQVGTKWRAGERRAQPGQKATLPPSWQGSHADAAGTLGLLPSGAQGSHPGALKSLLASLLQRPTGRSIGGGCERRGAVRPRRAVSELPLPEAQRMSPAVLSSQAAPSVLWSQIHVLLGLGELSL